MICSCSKLWKESVEKTVQDAKTNELVRMSHMQNLSMSGEMVAFLLFSVQYSCRLLLYSSFNWDRTVHLNFFGIYLSLHACMHALEWLID